jgi:hypothetical protein
MFQGQYVQHNLLVRETKANMLHAIHTFKKNNPNWSMVQVIVIDKDFTEISVLQEEFPHVRIFYCHFHVIRALESKAR